MEGRSKVLASLSPNAAAETVLYTGPDSSIMHIQGFTCANRGTDTTFRLSVSKKSAATTPSDYLYYDLPITANNTFMATLDFDLEARDVIRVYAGSANLAFTLFGGYQ